MDADFLRVHGTSIVKGHGEPVRLRGFCLGGWMNLENFIIGYPAHESGMRAALAKTMGEGKAAFFFERFLHYFITEDDVRFIKSLGCNVVRVPFNYRHFESDDKPFRYKPEGFALLDKLIGWARAQQVYVILDLHAAPGWQNRGWHCDNPGREAGFWGQKVFEDRAVALWEELARRYRNEATVAGYNVLNEPDADDVHWLNQFYRRVTSAIRAIDPNHILFLEGNRYGREFESLDPPFDSNAVYSGHNYVEPALSASEYPGSLHGQFYDRNRLEREYVEGTTFMRRHGVPNWVGEFGCLFTSGETDAVRLCVLADMMDIIEMNGHHWTLWTYKDIGRMGIVSLQPESEWMIQTHPVREAKTALRCDSWIERHETEVDRLIDAMTAHAHAVVPPSIEEARLHDALTVSVHDIVLAQALLPAFAEQFRGLSEAEIDRMMASFAFRNCVQRAGLMELIRGRTERA